MFAWTLRVRMRYQIRGEVLTGLDAMLSRCTSK